jgi:4-methylaminobutanoate oxidase (formaldehyde-forming)
MHAMDIMRMESGFLHWGYDISPEENQYEANLNFSISLKKDYDFIGKESLLKMKDKKPKKRLIMLCLQESKPGEPLMLHDEPIYLDNKIIGVTTSGNYSFNFNKNLSFGYIKSEHSNLELSKKNLFIEIEKIKYPAEVLLNPLKQTDFKKI